MHDALDTVSRECFRSFAALPNAELIDGHGAFGVISDVPLTFFNGIATANAPVIPSVIDVFRRRGRAFRWWVRDGLGAELVAHGMRFGWDSTGMTANLTRMPETAPPPGLQIVQVRDVRAMADWALVLTTVFGRPAPERETWLSAFGALGLDGGQWAHFVGYTGGTPVATTSLLVAGELAGVYHVATMKEARGRGFGSAVTRAALEHARDRGAREAALQSSEMAVSVYRGLGFVERGTLSMYDWVP